MLYRGLGNGICKDLLPCFVSEIGASLTVWLHSVPLQTLTCNSMMRISIAYFLRKSNGKKRHPIGSILGLFEKIRRPAEGTKKPSLFKDTCDNPPPRSPHLKPLFRLCSIHCGKLVQLGSVSHSYYRLLGDDHFLLKLSLPY